MDKSKVIPARYILTDENGKDCWISNINGYTELDLSEEGINTFDQIEDSGEEMQWMSVMLNEAHSHGLTVEVVQFALKYMREDTRLTPAQALRIGYAEWVK